MTRRSALIFFGKTVAYGDLGRQITRLASALQGLGIGRGNRMALLLANCPQHVISFYALMKLGAIVVPINPLSTERDLEYVFRDGGVRVAIALDLLAGRLEKAKARLREGWPGNVASRKSAAGPRSFPSSAGRRSASSWSSVRYGGGLDRWPKITTVANVVWSEC
jgi:acyl-CoA synthetase (AMP-forming)/AMP-acid ligase II